MAFYRKIDVRIWNDEKFISLSHIEKLLFIFLITHPSMTMLGAMRASRAGLAEELKVSPKAFPEAFDNLLLKGMVQIDTNANCIWLPNFLKYQTAESTNVLKNWIKQIEFIPECELRSQAISALYAYAEGAGKHFRETFKKAFSSDFQKTISNSEKSEEKRESLISPTRRSDSFTEQGHKSPATYFEGDDYEF